MSVWINKLLFVLDMCMYGYIILFEVKKKSLKFLSFKFKFCCKFVNKSVYFVVFKILIKMDRVRD